MSECVVGVVRHACRRRLRLPGRCEGQVSSKLVEKDNSRGPGDLPSRHPPFSPVQIRREFRRSLVDSIALAEETDNEQGKAASLARELLSTVSRSGGVWH